MYGRGIFAIKSVRKGEVVLIAGGYILTTKDEKWFSGDMIDKPTEIHEEFYIGPRTDTDIILTHQSYINHNCNPNVGVKGQIIYIAMRNIAVNEEITIDYAMILAASKSSILITEFSCKCGSQKCRSKVTEDDWQLPELQKRYKGYFSWYIQEKIDKLNEAKRRKKTMSIR